MGQFPKDWNLGLIYVLILSVETVPVRWALRELRALTLIATMLCFRLLEDSV